MFLALRILLLLNSFNLHFLVFFSHAVSLDLIANQIFYLCLLLVEIVYFFLYLIVRPIYLLIFLHIVVYLRRILLKGSP